MQRKFIKLHPVAKDITGKRFGRLLALGPVGVIKFPSGANHVRWLCRCDCGNEKVISIAKLSTNYTKSCGCFRREIGIGNKRGATHDMARSPEYRAWRSMKKRCLVPTTKTYRLYGGRGIKVCLEWQESFEAFFAYVGKRPSRKHSLDRFPDNNGNYEPGNVRWATATEQGRNRRTNHIVTAFGRTAPLADFFKDGSLGLDYGRALQRLKYGWGAELAIGQESNRHG